ncbi:DUF5916 domain-containing protein [uncultured Draconibacterium sp.]|uniref:carbohydrate binding family 9 domain-containing protein n=1 Tax=uncultured Draconibacterium sp. TaxID=1573823 RepID=UPI002AA80E42|nr:DUF5916 domain-containing protein [uncultured Draconibacterium sp.]
MKNLIRYMILLNLFVIVSIHALQAQDEVGIKPLTGEIEFDGLVNEPAWKLSQQFPLTMHFPVFNNAPTEKSQVYLTFDNDYLWVGAILYYNDVDNIVSTSKKRDEESENSDAFGILLDSYDDNENALAFFTMPSGLKIDYSVSNDGEGGGPGPGMSSKNYTWNSYWDVKTTTTNEAWHVEMRIPFSSLRFQSKNGITKMGLIVNRSISHLNEINTYPPIDTKYGRGANTRPSLAKTIVFEDINPRNPVYISPYILAGTTRMNELNENETDYEKSDDPELTGGLDVKYNLNNNLTLDFTVNTDFAQVEADDEQVNLTRYSLFFPEKRLFFQERSGIFSYELGGPQNLFYSRNIGIAQGEPVTIYGGVRMVGRVGKWDVGFLDMNTADFEETPSENFGVARLRRQVINENSYVGGMMTTRLGFDGSYNIAYGFDGIFKYTDVDYITIKLAQSQDKSMDTKVFSMDPTFFSLELNRRSEAEFLYEAKYAYWGENFDPKSGFVFINNVHEVRASTGYGWIADEKSPIFKYSFEGDFSIKSRMEDGKVENMELAPQFKMDLKNGIGMFISPGYNKEGVPFDFELPGGIIVEQGDYSYWAFRSHFNTPRTKKIVANFGIDGGGFYDGNQFAIDLETDFNISSSFQLSAFYKFDKVRFDETNQEFTNNLARLKATYMLNTKLSMSAYMQYNELESIVLSNFRLRYNPRDGNDLYLVLNDTRFADKKDLTPTPPGFLSQTILLKYTHTFRL